MSSAGNGDAQEHRTGRKHQSGIGEEPLSPWALNDRIPGGTQSIEHLLLKQELEDFYAYECELLDSRQLRSWLDLIAEDVRYLMPLRRNVKFGDWRLEATGDELGIMWIADDKKTLGQRVSQVETGVHWADEPASRVSHLVTNLRILAADPSPADATRVETTSRFLVHRNRLETETDIFVGQRSDVLRRFGPGWQIAKREVMLNQSVLLAKNLTLLF